MTATVTRLQRHPLKSHGREDLAATDLTTGAGLPWDRTWAVAHEAASITPGAWADCVNFSRGAKAPRLMAIDARLDEARRTLTLTHPDRPDLTFRPDAAEDEARFLDWVKPLCPPDRAQPAGLHSVAGRGMTDTAYPSVSVINLATHRALSERMGTELSPLRWRANLWIEGLEPFAEHDLIGQRVQAGDAVLEIVEPIGRCLATAANPATGERDADTLGALSAAWGHRNFGVYARVVASGRVRRGDAFAALA
jgi:uncharacterized protein